MLDYEGKNTLLCSMLEIEQRILAQAVRRVLVAFKCRYASYETRDFVAMHLEHCQRLPQADRLGYIDVAVEKIRTIALKLPYELGQPAVAALQQAFLVYCEKQDVRDTKWRKAERQIKVGKAEQAEG